MFWVLFYYNKLFIFIKTYINKYFLIINYLYLKNKTNYDRSRDIVNVENVSTLVMSTAENDLFIEVFLLNLLSVAVDIM